MKKMKILGMSLAILLNISALNAKVNDKVYVTVNGKNITTADIAIVLKDQRVNFDTLPKKEQTQFLEKMVQKALLSAKALKSDVVKEKLYKSTLKAAIQNMKEELALQIWMQKIAKNIKISDQEIKKFYNKNKTKFVKPLELKASHILLKTKKEAQDIIKQLNASKSLKETFTKLAKEKSTGPSGKIGGELGWFTMEKMVAEFSNAANKLEKGSITKKPVKTQFGFHIIYLDDKKLKGVVPLKEASNQIKSMISQDRFRKSIDEIIKKEEKKAKIIYK
jgi:parvulin-like peptidyl-prolyl isomerase